MKRPPLVIFLVLSFSGPATCQLPQSHPELCGTPSAVVAPPPGMSAVLDRDSVAVRFFFGNRADPVSVTAFLDEIAEVCPLSDGRIVAFGADSGALPGGTTMFIISGSPEALLDTIGGYRPAMSPDQRWIVYRKAYSPHNSEPVSEEYLFYDLSKSATQNRAAGIPLVDDTDVGATVFPPGMANLPSDNTSGLPEEQRHSAASGFFWSQDSKSLAFADVLLGRTSIVLVTIGSSGATGAFVHPLDGVLACAVGDSAATRIELGPEQGAQGTIIADFATECGRKRLELHRADFQPAEAEVHVPKTYTRKAVRGDQQ